MIIQSHTQSQSLRPITTAHLAQTMTLMSLTAQELYQKIEVELASNPALELVEDRYCPSCKRSLPTAGPCPVCSHAQKDANNDPIVFVSSRDDFYTPRNRRMEEDLPEDEIGAQVEELPVYVLRQIATELDPQDRPIAAHILTSLDEDGLLRQPLMEIARYHHALISHVEEVLRLIQHAEPVGVGSRSPQEALIVQLEVLGETRRIPDMAAQAVREGMDLLSRRQYVELGRKLGITTAKAREIAQFISDNLYPYPARAHWGDIHNAPEPPQDFFSIPDVIISKLNDANNYSIGCRSHLPADRKATHQSSFPPVTHPSTLRENGAMAEGFRTGSTPDKMHPAAQSYDRPIDASIGGNPA